jgi:hypothetical protein
MYDLPSTRLVLLFQEIFGVVTACSIPVYPEISLAYAWRQRRSVQCEKRQIGFQKFNHYPQQSQEWPEFHLVARTGHAYHVMSHVCYNYWHEDSTIISINKWMTAMYDIFSIRMIENFVIKLEALSPCMRNQLILKYFWMCVVFLWNTSKIAFALRWSENIHTYVLSYWGSTLK